jgi:hypothetical protein
MELQGWQAGVVSGMGFALVTVGAALVARRLPAVHRRWVGLLLLFVLAAVALLVPPPLVLLGRSGAFTIVNEGHAGGAFVAPYLAICVVAITVAAALVLQRGKG